MGLACGHVSIRGLLVVLGLVFWAALPLVDSSRILFTTSVASTISHYMNFREVMRVLTERNHQVTFLVPVSNPVITHKKHERDSHFKFEMYDGKLNQSTFNEHVDIFKKEITTKSSEDLRLINFAIKAVFGKSSTTTSNPWEVASDECDSLLGNETLVTRLNNSNYDLLIGDPAANLCTPLLAEVLSIPFIQYATQGLQILHHDRWLGQPIYPSFMPMPYMPFCDDMSFIERTANFICFICGSHLVDRNTLSLFEKVKEKYGIRPDLSLNDLIKKAWLHLVNSDVHVQDLPSPLPPNFIQVGGITARPALPFNESLERFFEGSGQHGVVVISLGTSLSFGDEQLDDIARAISRLRQRVIWLLRDKAPTHVGNNTMIVNWLSMNDILGHPKTKLLVNHGGTSTVQEAIYHGVPMVLVPLASDMFKIADLAVCRGMAVKLAMPTLTGTILKDAIESVLSQPSYSQSSRHLSSIFKAKTPSPIDTAAFWIEHVMKHGGDHLKLPPAQNLSVLQFMLTCILGVCVISLILLLKLSSLFIRKMYKKI
ncbi:UDP-glucuronosyltransferase 2C1-like [Asterias amurensis]|uniref:UDP-glucuronosyltransferase 2C1-like n=1 Tax=Asterias amurensis TaxID=7602 RepID=UPI003AB25F43